MQFDRLISKNTDAFENNIFYKKEPSFLTNFTPVLTLHTLVKKLFVYKDLIPWKPSMSKNKQLWRSVKNMFW